MIKLSEEEYELNRVNAEFFWKELDDITAGQSMNPEWGYTTQHQANYDNVFAGRKVKNKFSIFLYRPLVESWRTEILAKGTVTETPQGLSIYCKFEIPFWSTLMFLLLGTFHTIIVGFFSILAAAVFAVLGTLFYAWIVRRNHIQIKQELSKQVETIEAKYNGHSCSIKGRL